VRWSNASAGAIPVGQPSGLFPAITLSSTWHGAALGQAVEAITEIKRQMNVPDRLLTTFQGNAQAFQDSLRTQPLLILAALVAIYIILAFCTRA